MKIFIKNIYVLLRNRKYPLILFLLMEKFLRIVFKKEILPPLPVQINIETTSLCNLHCPLCPTGIGTIASARSRRLMTFDDLKKIIDEIKWFTGRVFLHNYGEPFLNKDLLKMIRYAKEARLYVKLSTNGEFFDSIEYAREVVSSGIDYIFISVDGKDQETHEKYRIGSNFSKLTQGFRFMKEAKKALKSATPLIELQFLRSRYNEHQRDQMKQFAAQLGADIYTERTFGACSGDKELAGEFISDDPQATLLKVNAEGKVDYAGEPMNRCYWVNTMMVINSDGTVSPCIEDPFVTLNMGNIHDASIKEIWKGDKYSTLRHRIKTDRKSIPTCNSCSHAKTESTDWKKEYMVDG